MFVCVYTHIHIYVCVYILPSTTGRISLSLLGYLTNIFHAVGPASSIHLYFMALIIFSENICGCILPLHIFLPPWGNSP